MSVFDVLREKLEESKSDWNNDYNVPINNAIEIVNQVEQEYNNGWIPCSERLPEDGCVYEVTEAEHGTTFTDFASYDEQIGRWMDSEGLVMVLAWREHSQPYQLKKGVNT